MLVYRVEKTKYIPTLLQGIPGEKCDFRWNTKGNAIIYASASKSLALHEKSGNMSKPFYGLSTSFVLVAINIPDGDYQVINVEDLPSGWDEIGSYHPETQAIGDKFINSDTLALFVPSTIVKGEYNVLINPRKVPDFDVDTFVEKINPRLQDTR